MRAVRYHDCGEVNVLRVEDCERPEPAHDEVLVEMRAASINPIDAILREQGAPRLPKTTGSDIAGVVAAAGADVDNHEEGDRVFATGLHVGRFGGGSFADFAVVPTDLLAPLPDGVDFEEGAAVALVGVTVWRAMVHHAHLEPGATAFIHGGNGGVGHVAVGFAAALGATPVATARPEYHDAVRGLGAAAVIDYTRDDLTEAAVEATGGADLVLDALPGTYFDTDVAVAGFGGDVSVLAGDEATLSDVPAARSKELDIHMMSMSNLATHPDAPDIGPILDRLGRLVAEDRLEVVIDRTYPLEDAAQAHRAIMEESFLGKIVLTP
ncbi:zinc-binding dehydrogenase [Halovenus sp. WSH3]|uniref:Zinc-binding dehydrogenase n=1 Tax=Halovenus carboxidivorans TaxID=2692199 RepID=A0A6B0T414_9EURY|nr:zinc-binding dehydrogenase [Halovenus carboxidivorans]MXR53028.1 zinc-binding dehydrogenase [Halovenus carboxidivorans]